jgi:hypothetical protein
MKRNPVHDLGGVGPNLCLLQQPDCQGSALRALLASG